MFDLAIIFGGTPPALPLLLLVGTWTGAYVLYYTGQSRKVRIDTSINTKGLNLNYSESHSSRISRRLCLDCRFSPSWEP